MIEERVMLATNETDQVLGEVALMIDADVVGIRKTLEEMGVAGEALEKAVIAMASREMALKQEARRAAVAATIPAARPAGFGDFTGKFRKEAFQGRVGIALAEALQKNLPGRSVNPPRMPGYERIKGG